MNKVKCGSSLAALLVSLALLINWKYVVRPLMIVYYLRAIDHFSLLMLMMSLIFLVINIIAAVGLYRMKKWGYITTYAAIAFSTLILSVSYLPFFDYLFPVRYSFAGLLIGNIAFLIFVIYLQMNAEIKQPKERQKKPRRKSKK